MLKPDSPFPVSAPISVVIPAYNTAATIRAAITSVAQQTLLPLEVIVVDDASNDKTVSVVRSIQSTFPSQWLKLIELPTNVGAASARNAGWNAATGTHIAFLDSDDIWHPSKLEIQWEYFCRHPKLVLCGHAFQFSWDAPFEIGKAAHAKSITRRQVLWRNPFVTPSVMVLRRITLRFRAGKRHMEDHLLWQEIVLSGYSACKLDAPLATINKLQFGMSGLSSQLWAMEMGELDNYWKLRQSNYIGTGTALFFSAYSLAKFARRLIVVAARRITQFAGQYRQGK